MKEILNTGQAHTAAWRQVRTLQCWLLLCEARGADATGVQLHLDRLDCYMNQRVAASQSLILPASIRITTSADGAFNFGLGKFYLRQVILTSPAVANLTDTPHTANTAFRRAWTCCSYYPDNVSYPSAYRLLHCRTDTPPNSTCSVPSMFYDS